MDKEISVPFKDLGNSQQITRRNVKLFKERGLDLHKNEIGEVVDDHASQKRIYKGIKARKFFGPWSHRG